MNDKNHQAATVNEGYLAAAQLNKVPGFDPLKLLRRTGNENQEEELKLDLRYKKLWFRLAYPKGRMKLIARHITEQMAIFEAQIYLDRSDNEPVGNFTATCTYEQAADFVKAAQDTALDYALANAGFGVLLEASSQTRSVSSQPQVEVTRAPAAAPPVIQHSAVKNVNQPGAGKEEVKGNIETGAIPPLLKIMPKPATAVSGGAAAEPKPAAVLNEAAILKGPTSVKPAEVVAIHNDNGTALHSSVHNMTVKKEELAPVRNAAVETAVAEAMAGGIEPVSQSASECTRKESVNREQSAAIQHAAAMSQVATAAVTSDTLPVTREMAFDRLPVEPVRPVPSPTGEALPVERSMETAGVENQAAQTMTVPHSRFTQPTMAAVQPLPTREHATQEPVSEEELPVFSTQPAVAVESPQPKYTVDMPVEEIIQRMTFEEAQNVKVDVGTCNGWTMAQVVERRPPSLKWYVYGYKENNNILRAAAQIMLDSISKEKAG